MVRHIHLTHLLVKSKFITQFNSYLSIINLATISTSLPYTPYTSESMLDYDWGNPYAGEEEEPAQDNQAQNRQIFDHYNHNFTDALINPNGFNPVHNFDPNTTQTHFHPLFDPTRNYVAPVYPPPPMLSLEPSGGYVVVPKNEPSGGGGFEFMSRIGLNLGGRTYFSSSEDDFVNRLYRRSRALEPASFNAPRCQVEGCTVDLTHAKHYHRRHKVCEFHSKSSTVIAAGLTQRFCQQCSRFHLLTEFDNGKRSCRKRLADHNRRRRKSQQPNKSNLEHSRNVSSSSDSVARSPTGSVTQPPLTIAVSPPRISLDTFRQRSYDTCIFE